MCAACGVVSHQVQPNRSIAYNGVLTYQSIDSFASSFRYVHQSFAA